MCLEGPVTQSLYSNSLLLSLILILPDWRAAALHLARPLSPINHDFTFTVTVRTVCDDAELPEIRHEFHEFPASVWSSAVQTFSVFTHISSSCVKPAQLSVINTQAGYSLNTNWICCQYYCEYYIIICTFIATDCWHQWIYHLCWHSNYNELEVNILHI